MHKRIILIGLSIALLASACSAGRPQISAETTSFSFGEVVNGEIVSQTVSIANTGSAPLVVEAISTSCGCTEAELDAMSIPPGQSSSLTIHFDSGAHGPDEVGKVTRQVFIASNDPDQPEMVIEFDALIVAPNEN